MKKLQFIALSAVAVLFLAGGMQAQKTVSKKTTSKRTTTYLPPLDVRAAREKTENQLSNVNLFVDRFGPIAQGIETLDASSRTKRLPKATLAQNDANKQKVIAAIQNLKAGLANLESEFRTKPALMKYMPSIQGITDLAARAEDSAIAGKFVASKDPLRQSAQKLIDTLAIMPR